jgi:tetratricopeptide repeat protein 8
MAQRRSKSRLIFQYLFYV